MTHKEAREVIVDNDWLYEEHCFTNFEIEALNVAAKALENPWHSVKERMPEIVHRKAGKEYSDPCLCINEDGEYLPLVYNESYDDDGPVYFWTKVTEIYDTDIEPDITHWMPIPELPKEKED